MGQYNVDSAPTLVVNGRFVTSPAQFASRSANQSPAAASEAVLTVIYSLESEARAENGATDK